MSKAKGFSVILDAGGLSFAFLLSCKPWQLGETYVDHIWMDVRTVYGQRGRRRQNLHVMADYFWMRCLLAGLHEDPQQQEVYLLACLSPYVRSNAAQRVLPDARLWTGGSAVAKRQSLLKLDQLLQQPPCEVQGETGRLTMAQFHARTRDLLMRPYKPAERRAYRELCGVLFDDQVRAAMREGMVDGELIVAKWDRLNRRFGRHNDRPLQRTALDVLSYESRAAVRRCYSCVWNDLIAKIADDHPVSAATQRFLRLIHLEPRLANPARTSIFHGQVLALHPAWAMLMLTPTGQNLLGEFLHEETAEQAESPFQRLLWGVYVALCCYDEARGARRGRL